MESRIAYLMCPRCFKDERLQDKAHSEDGPLTMNALMGGVEQHGVLYEFAKLQHDSLGHNRFSVYDQKDTKIGEAGFGRQTGIVFWIGREV